MNKSDKLPEEKGLTKQGRELELDELGSVTGGEFMSSGCSDRDTYKCTCNPYTCDSDNINKGLCTFG